MTFQRVAVLNRGDAAMRFLRTARELADLDGPALDVVAVFTEPDRDAPFVRLADDSVCLGAALQLSADGIMKPAYCMPEAVVQRLVDAGCEAVWPGWGFMSEDPAFVELLDEAGITFIGPPAAAMRSLGDKAEAKVLAEQCGVPLAPWVRLDLDEEPARWIEAVERVGYPAMVKASNGGGGRGIRRVEKSSDLAVAVRAVKAEASAAFGDGDVLVEQCIESARHVEVQFIVGVDGRAETLGVRDCSVQRRHQKVIEEAPSPVLSPVEEERLTSGTARLAEAAGYRGVGTAEYLYVPGSRVASFCEVNARLQVEHTVTEMVWGVDLVRAQIEIAQGLAHARSPGPRGWAIEARITAEDVERGFAPAPGRVLVHRPAAGPNVRVDSGVRAGSEIPAEFDSMIAKVISWGPTRDRALATLTRAVREYEILIEDGATNRGALLDLLARPEVRDATVNTSWLEGVDDLGVAGRDSSAGVALATAAIELAAAQRDASVEGFLLDARSGVPTADTAATRPVEVELSLRGNTHRVSVRYRGDSAWTVEESGRSLDIRVERLDATAVVVDIGGRTLRVLVHRGSGAVTVDVEGTLHRVIETDLGAVRASGPALVVDLAVAVGDQVQAGQRVGTVESMKTEAPLIAEISGDVERILVPVGTQVRAGEAVLVLRPQETSDSNSNNRDSEKVSSAALWPERTVPVAETTRLVVEAVLLGREFTTEEYADTLDVLEGVVREAHAFDEVDARNWQWTAESLGRFVDTENLFERNLLLLDDHSAAISAESAFHDFCRSQGADPDALPELRPLLNAALSHYGASLDASSGASSGVSGVRDVRIALWRLSSTRARLVERERLMVAMIRAVASLVRAGHVASDRFRSQLVDVESAATGSMRALAEAAAVLRLDIGAAGSSARTLAPSEVDTRTIVGLDRYENVSIEVLDAISTDAGRSIVARVTSCEEPSDIRTVLVVELSDAPVDLGALDETQVEPFAELFEVGVGLLRRRREDRSRTHDRDSWWAALHIVVHGANSADPASMLQLSHRFEPGTRGLALQEFTVALVPDGAQITDETSLEYSIRRRGHARLEVEASHGMLPARVRTSLDRRALTAKRLGVVDPWELIGLLEGRVSADDLPHPSLAHGRFVELDLDPTDVDGRARLVPVDRAPAAHDCSVIVGVVHNPLPGREAWAERVFIAGDPLKAMGSLGEPECRRIAAAIDLATERRVPIEWLSVSSGARIAWDSGTENLDWTAAVLRRIVEFTSAGGEINVIVAGVNVGAQSYWNAEATMLMHTRGVLVMTPNSSMVLTGKRALEFSGSVAAQDEIGIGGHDRIMGPNGQSQYRADDLAHAYAILLDHYALTYSTAPDPAGGSGAIDGSGAKLIPGATGEMTAICGRAPKLATDDPVDRDVRSTPYKGGDEDFATVGEIFDPQSNPGRKRAFAVRSVMDAVVDTDARRMERWRTMADADGAVVWETRIGGYPVSLIGIESRNRSRKEQGPVDGPSEWAGGTLYPAASKKVARALRSASGSRAAVVLANLSGFDGSPESLRRMQLEYGAEIARAVVEFRGPIVFVVIGRYHGGAYVVFSKELNSNLTALAVEGSFASVIGGAPAAAVVLTREVRARVDQDPLVVAARTAHADASAVDGALSADRKVMLLERLDEVTTEATARTRAAVASEFDSVHTVQRAVEVGSLDEVIPASRLRPAIVEVLSRYE